jgi:hypothetical protein
MRNIFELSKREQRVVIFIVVLLVAAAFTQHFLQAKAQPPRTRSTSSPTAAPAVRPKTESDADDSR